REKPRADASLPFLFGLGRRRARPAFATDTAIHEIILEAAAAMSAAAGLATVRHARGDERSQRVRAGDSARRNRYRAAECSRHKCGGSGTRAARAPHDS